VFDAPIVFVDVETTGLDPVRERITEIAMVYSDGQKIIGEEAFLVNPQCHIPTSITSLTGISNEMVKNAPPFSGVAKQIVAGLKDRLVVGHNVRFDQGFLSAEFSRLGFPLRINTACTVRLSKTHLKEKIPSYSLGKVCAHLGVELKNAHRALADARASAEIFHILFKNSQLQKVEEFLQGPNSRLRFPPNMKDTLIETLPTHTGVYYFKDENGKIIYVGKAKNIKDRVLSHFSADLHDLKERRLKEKTFSIDTFHCPTELMALLKEQSEIKKHKPFFNRVGIRDKHPWSLNLFPHSKNNPMAFNEIRILNEKDLAEFPNTIKILNCASLSSARAQLETLKTEHRLCANWISFSKKAAAGTKTLNSRGCFGYQVDQCLGACVAKESADSYNARCEQLLSYFEDPLPAQSFLIVEKVTTSVWAMVYVEKASFRAMGISKRKPTAQHPCLDLLNYESQPSRDHDKIIRQFLKKNHAKVKDEDFFTLDLSQSVAEQLALNLDLC